MIFSCAIHGGHTGPTCSSCDEQVARGVKVDWKSYAEDLKNQNSFLTAQHERELQSLKAKYEERDHAALKFCEAYNNALDTIVELKKCLGEDPGDY